MWFGLLKIRIWFGEKLGFRVWFGEKLGFDSVKG